MNREAKKILKLIRKNDEQFELLQNGGKMGDPPRPQQADELPLALRQKAARYSRWQERTYWAQRAKQATAMIRSFRKI